MRKYKNAEWKMPNDGEELTWGAAHGAILMDIRDELQKLNRVFQCYRFLAIPDTLNQIKRNTTKRRKKKVNR